MEPKPNKRSLRSLRLTRRFHLRYMGLWILLTCVLCIFFTVICYLLVEQPAGNIYRLSQAELDAYLLHRQYFIVGTIVMTIAITLCVVTLGVLTAHRLAGPYIRLCKACEAIRSGDLEHQLKFRSYDHLEIVEDAFNSMIDSVKQSRSPE